MPRALAGGDIVGEVVEVSSGRQQPIRDIGELLAFLRSSSDALDLEELS
jgi:hypothetical protein